MFFYFFFFFFFFSVYRSYCIIGLKHISSLMRDIIVPHILIPLPPPPLRFSLSLSFSLSQFMLAVKPALTREMFFLFYFSRQPKYSPESATILLLLLIFQYHLR